MEQEWANHLKSGDAVNVKIEITYSDDTMRPSGFKVGQSINGGPPKTIRVKNEVRP